MGRKNSIRTGSSPPSSVEVRASIQTKTYKQSSEPKIGASMQKDSTEPSGSTAASVASITPTATRPPAPELHRKEHKSMKLQASVPREKMIDIEGLAAHEFARGRPLIILSRPDGPVSPYLREKGNWVSGFEYKVAEKKNKKGSDQYVDWRSIYQIKDCSCSVFYGPKNQSCVTIYASELEKFDGDGSIMETILRVNAPGQLKAEQAEGVGLIAACIGAGYIGIASPEEAQKLLRALSPENRTESLRHALICCCDRGDEVLVHELFRLGAEPNVMSMDDESTPLEIAIGQEHVGLVRILLSQGADPDIELASGMNCRSFAKMVNNQTIMNLLEDNTHTRKEP